MAAELILAPEAEQDTVYHVFHTSRDPEKWRERLS
jgi:hypothetical protein